MNAEFSSGNGLSVNATDSTARHTSPRKTGWEEVLWLIRGVWEQSLLPSSPKDQLPQDDDESTLRRSGIFREWLDGEYPEAPTSSENPSSRHC